MSVPSLLRPMAIAGLRLRFVIDNLRDTRIGPSPIHGHGLFATRDLAQGEVLGLLDGQVVGWPSFDAMQQAHPFGKDDDGLFVEWNALSRDALLVRPFRTKYGFVNHSRTPNVELAHDPLRVVVSRRVATGGELTLDYRREPLRAEYLRKATYL